MRKHEKVEQEPRVHIQCAHVGCAEPAVMYRKVGKTFARLCKIHDLRHAQQEADDFCRENGLTTRAAQMAFIREKLTTKPTPREPWQNVMQTHGLLPIAYEMAMKYLERHGGYEREPGQEG
jgi:hypothetical protein